jgi:hypothetical protein
MSPTQPAVAPTYYGYPMKQWESAKREIRDVLIKRASRGSLISYGELTRLVHSILFDPNDYPLGAILGEVSTEENREKRGMLSVLVVHNDSDGRPGAGFFALAEQFGRDTSDREKCWINELNVVFDYWSRQVPR